MNEAVRNLRVTDCDRRERVSLVETIRRIRARSRGSDEPVVEGGPLAPTVEGGPVWPPESR